MLYFEQQVILINNKENMPKDYADMNNEEQEELYQNFLSEPDAFYEKAENDQLLQALQRSYKERFLTMTHLMKIGTMLSKAKITHHKPTGK